MNRRLAAALSLSLLSVTGTALAQSAGEVKSAGAAFDSARAAFRDGHFAEAAEHFEAADSQVPSGKTLLLAMEARQRAGQTDRAATLAALVVARHGADDEFAAHANEFLVGAKATLFELRVECVPSCELVVGTRLIHGGAQDSRTVYLPAGDHRLQATWDSDRVREEIVSGDAGTSATTTFAAPAPNLSRPPLGPVAAKLPHMKPAPGESSTGLPQSVFWTGAVLTVVAGGASAWSYVDATNNPGVETVKRVCQEEGNDEVCQATLQQGQDADKRTNIILAVAGGLGLTTAVVGLFFTDWDTEDEPVEKKPEHVVTISPHLDIIDGAIVGAQGTFF
jgi:hypothetical protein